MKLLSWNCRGLGNPRTVRVLRDLIKSQKPDLLFLSETLVDNNVVDNLAPKFGFTSHVSVARVGRGGGLAVMWRRNLKCSVIDSSQNHVNLVMMEGNAPSWRLTCFYGYPERTRRRDSWNFIRQLASQSHLPWCVFGDFNDRSLSVSKSQGWKSRFAFCHSRRNS